MLFHYKVNFSPHFTVVKSVTLLVFQSFSFLCRFFIIPVTGKLDKKKAITQQWLGINIPGTKEFSAALMAKSGDYNE